MTRTQYSSMLPSLETLSSLERVTRIAIGVALIGSVFAAKGPLDWAAAWPLLGIYPLLTGMIGVEPLRYFLERGSVAYRSAQFAFGGALIGSVFVAGQYAAIPHEELMVLPLVGAFYMLAGIMGRGPIATFEAALHDQPEMPATVAIETSGPSATSRRAAQIRASYSRAA